MDPRSVTKYLYGLRIFPLKAGETEGEEKVCVIIRAIHSVAVEESMIYFVNDCITLRNAKCNVRKYVRGTKEFATRYLCRVFRERFEASRQCKTAGITEARERHTLAQIA